MIIKEISTQSFTKDGERPCLFRNSEDYTPQQWDMIVKYLKCNAAAGHLRYEIATEEEYMK